jgi:hypothetical protein
MQKILSQMMILLPLVFILGCSNYQATDINLSNTAARVYFSPHGGCTDAILKEIDKAKSEILVQAYSLKYSAADFTFNMGIPTFIDAEHQIAHNKIMVLDKETVITGSFNFTKAAEEKNAENILILKSKELAKVYIDNWNKHKAHSQEYKGRQ